MFTKDTNTFMHLTEAFIQKQPSCLPVVNFIAYNLLFRKLGYVPCLSNICVNGDSNPRLSRLLA